MKLAVILLVAFAASGISAWEVPPFGHGPLYNALRKYVDVMPIDEIRDIVITYALEDEEFQKLLVIVEGPEYKELVRFIESLKEVIDYMNFLHARNIDIYDMINALNDRIGLDRLQPPPRHPHPRFYNAPKITGGVKGLIHDINALVPTEKFVAIHNDLMKTSPAYREFVEYITSPPMATINPQIGASKQYRDFERRLREAGIVLGNRDVSQLQQDFQDFLNLIRRDDIMEIVFSYLMVDEEVQRVVDFMFSPRFHDLVLKVEALPEYRELIKYVQNAGLDVYSLIQRLHDLVGMDNFVPPLGIDRQQRSNTGGVAALINDIKAIIPWDKIKALYYEKLETSKDFKDLIDRLNGPEFQKIIDNLFQDPTFLNIIQVAKEFKLELFLEEIKNVISAMCGIKWPEHS